VVFALNGGIFGSLFSRLPAIQERTEIGDGQLGLALLCSMLGLMASQPIGGALVARVGSRPLVRAGALACALSLIPVSLAGTFGALALAFLFVGSSNGLLDVSMNVHGLAVERRLGRPILSTLHAAFSFGVLAAASAGGLIAAAGVGVRDHMAGATVVAVCVAVAATRRLLPREADAAPEGPLLARPTRALAAIGLFAFCVLLSEGAVNDWAAVYLEGDLGAGEGLAAAGLAAFSLTMGFGRLTGDRLAEWLGPVRLARGGAALAAAGMTLAVAGGRQAAAIVGFAAMGAGLSSLFPLAIRAGSVRGDAPGPAVAAVSGTGYLGFIAGPPLVGLLAELFGLRSALVLVAVLCGAAAVLAGAVRAPVRAR
jgi:predicted MFS family arabinose efflux permease